MRSLTTGVSGAACRCPSRGRRPTALPTVSPHHRRRGTPSGSPHRGPTRDIGRGHRILPPSLPTRRALRRRAQPEGSTAESSGQQPEEPSEEAPPAACEPGKTVLGFVGMGIMGVPMALTLLKAGYEVVVWNRSPGKCAPVVEAGARQVSSAAEVARQADVTFGMLSDPFAAFSVACRPGGVAEGIGPGKGYVDVSTVDETTANRIAACIDDAGGDFLEAPVSGSKGPAETGSLIFLGAGNRDLYDRVRHPLEVMGKASFYLGFVGAGANMKLVVNQMMGSMMAAFSEGLTLADKAGLSQKDVLEVVGLGAITTPMYSLKGPAMVEGQFPTAFPLKHQEKDLRLSLRLAQEVGLSVPVAEATEAQFKKALDLGYGEEDFSAVLRAVAFDEDLMLTDPRISSRDDFSKTD